MKRILISTAVEADFEKVVADFNENLLKRLNPPFPRVNLLRYDGNEKGSEIHIELNFFIFKTTWISVITDFMHGRQEYTFVDEGKKLPFFLKSWRHRHSILIENGKTVIRDDIRYEAGQALWESFLYIPFLLQFRYRQPVYRSVFKKGNIDY